MSLRAELETWDAALKAYDAEDFTKALDLFGRIADSSKILTNIGLIYATLGEHELAVEQFIGATELDQYLAVAYFQCGVSNFLLGKYNVAFDDFDKALLYLRQNQAINYEQLGLQFRLYSAEVLFNKGLCLIYLGNESEGLQDMAEAQKEKVTEEHNVIDEAIRDRGEGYTVFSIPVGILYRPPENKLKNAKPKDYLGKAKLVAAENANEAYTTFTGVTRMQQGYSPSGAPLDSGNSLAPGGANLAPSASFSRARDPDTVRPLERAGSATARLERQNTTVNAASREPGGGGGATGLQKSNTIGARNIVSPPPRETSNSPIREGARGGGGGLAGPMRGLTIRNKDALPPTPPDDSRPNTGSGGGGRGRAPDTRVTEIYDEYLDGYGNDAPPLPEDSGRVRAWASKTQPGAPQGPSRAVSQRVAVRSQYGGSTVSRRRPPNRQNTYPRSQGSGAYEGEEEGYGSGEFDEGFELVRIKVKIHFNGEVRGMALTPDVPYEEFLDRVHSKFNKNFGEMTMKFIDEDGMKVSLKDDSDYDLAIETARDSAKGKPDGKLVVWVE
ncbi:hypothetical protein CPB86DRAFT_779815 [Serendipita vermifera]|nr:hypothetical protein CPB86DRAFT_779815 [Serendipita vermifera]